MEKVSQQPNGWTLLSTKAVQINSKQLVGGRVCTVIYALCILSTCAIVNPFGKINKQPLHPIPFSHPFQIIGVNMMDLPVTKSGNWYFVVFQDFLTKFPLVPDQKTICLAKLVVEQVNHFF